MSREAHKYMQSGNFGDSANVESTVPRGAGRPISTIRVHQRSREIRVLAFNIALDDPLAEVDRSRQMILVVLVILADIDQDKLFPPVQPGLDFVDIGFSDALFRIFNNFQETRWMLLRHRSTSGSILPAAQTA
jgi:hypothetical protein